jgi:uncharacterized Fe-S radical SAM superfamily protein PflX
VRVKPSFLELGPAEVRRRAAEAFDLLGPRCLVCPRGCRVDRRADEAGLCEELGTGCYVNLMAQYSPSGRVGRGGEFPELDRRVHREEYAQALALAEELGLRLDPRSCAEGRALATAG